MDIFSAEFLTTCAPGTQPQVSTNTRLLMLGKPPQGAKLGERRGWGTPAPAAINHWDCKLTCATHDYAVMPRATLKL